MTISVAIAVADEPEAHRKKQGDIIAIMPGGHQWSQGEISNHLILEIALPPTATMDMAYALMARYLTGGVLNYTGSEAVIAKRRFKVDWIKLKQIINNAGIVVDWAKVENKAIPYSPLSLQDADPTSQTASIDPTKVVHDKYNNRLIRAADFPNWITG